MKNVISVSRRADVIAQFYPWLLDKVKEGNVELQNPFFPNKRYQVSLKKEDVQAMVLWSKDFSNFVRMPAPLNIYSLFFQYTINMYDKPIENVKPLDVHLANLKWIVDHYGSDKVAVRFDPVLFTKGNGGIVETMRERKEAFKKLLDSIDKNIKSRPRIITSYIDLNNRVRENMNNAGIEIYEASQQEVTEFFAELKAIADERGFPISSCADIRLEQAGIERRACVDGKLISNIDGEKVSCAKDPSQRKDCLCTKSVDIGIYPYLEGGKKCIHACKYCYVKGAI